MAEFPLPPRFFIHSSQLSKESIQFDKSDAAHIAALRLRTSEQIDLVVDEIHIIRVTLSKVDKSTLYFSKSDSRPFPAPVLPKITLIQALPKGDKLSEIINHCVQLGVSEMGIWQSERSISTPDSQKWASKVERFESIAKLAAMQSKQNFLTKIHPTLLKIPDIHAHSTQNILCWENEKSQSLKAELATRNIPDSVTLVVGPEGGISDREVQYLRDCGFKTVHLGESILRAEVAAFSAISNIRFWYAN